MWLRGEPQDQGWKGRCRQLTQRKDRFLHMDRWGRWGQWELARGAREPLDADRPGEGAWLPHRELCDDCRLSIPRSPCQFVSRPFINLATSSGRAQCCRHTCFLGFQAQRRWLSHVHTATAGEKLRKRQPCLAHKQELSLLSKVSGRWERAT